jgi:hypothetical protein
MHGQHEQATLVGHIQQDSRVQSMPQGGIIASTSDSLFHPVSNVPSSHTFTLPDIPFNPALHHHAYNQPPDTFHRSFPHTPFTSYNNPAFVVPPSPPHPLYNHVPSSDVNLQLAPAPLIPPRVQSHFPQPVYNHPFPVFDYPQHSFNHFPPPNPTFHHAPPAPSAYQVPPAVVSTPSPLQSLAVSPLPKTLLTVTHIPLLTSKHDFFPWDEGVTSLIRVNGLIGHILDPCTFVDPCRPDLAPVPAPALSIASPPLEIEASNRWWAEDNIAQHILVSRLGTVPRGLLPASNIITRTALSIYKLLLKYYGTCNFADCTELLHSLQNSTCTTGRVQEFVSKWRAGISRLQSAHFVFNVKICISLFVHGLPSIPAFNSLRADLPRCIASTAHDQDYGAFISSTETVLELDTIFRPTSQVPRQPRALPTTIPHLAPIPPDSTPVVPDPPSRVPRKELTCANCKSRGLRGVGHTDGTCFQPGGGMEGHREEYLGNKGRIHVM